MTIAQYFNKVKMLRREIFDLDPEEHIVENRTKRTIVHSLRPEYRGFISTVQGWHKQPSIIEFENLLASQEALAKKIGGVSLKSEEEALYANKSKGEIKRND
ncbi:hypothetical protein BC332_26006 [Capsicum chinense]|nr:hypothetical protein BC332_26006 [Capsicum chinense]